MRFDGAAETITFYFEADAALLGPVGGKLGRYYEQDRQR
jgi:hypothetical protein